MGLCCSCCKDITGGSSSSSNGANKETEMKGGEVNNFTSAANSKLSISRNMTAPTIAIDKENIITGYGLALAGCTIEQDSAYWEWHILNVGGGEDSKATISLGVSTRKDRAFHRKQQQKLQPADAENNPEESTEENNTNDEDDGDDSNGREYMKDINVKTNDTIGICVQQSDLPMIQFMLNGDLLHELAINRFRGTVYPSIYIPHPSEEEQGKTAEKNQDEKRIKVQLIFNENLFRELSPGPRFGPVIVARGLM